jgi:hypothetical protein
MLPREQEQSEGEIMSRIFALLEKAEHPGPPHQNH